ncbi:MAG: cation:proton antiporter [Candidatus Micrarchaeota archaeon]
MQGIDVVSFGLVLLFSAIAGILSVRLKLPPVAGLLAAGVIIGPFALGLVSDASIETLAEIGAVLLLFTIGIEFSISKLLSLGIRAILGSFILVFITFMVMHQAIVILGFENLYAIFFASMFSMGSTAIIMKILEQKGYSRRKEVPVLVTMLIIEDIIAIFVLTFLSNLKRAAYTTESFTWAVFLSFGMLILGYYIFKKILERFSEDFLKYQADDTTILFSFILCIVMSLFATFLGFSASIGAFLAGSLVSTLPKGREMEKAIRPFSLVFSSFFFLSVGMLVDPKIVLSSLPILLVLIIVFVIVVFTITALIVFLITSNSRSAVFSGLAMLPLGEFSLLIAKEGAPIFGPNIVSIAGGSVLITALLCSFLMDRYEKIHSFVRKSISADFKRTITDASCYLKNVISTFEPDGVFHKVCFSEFEQVKSHIQHVSALVIIGWFFSAYFSGYAVSILPFDIEVNKLVLFMLLVTCIVPMARIIVSLKRVLSTVYEAFARTTPEAKQGAILGNLFLTWLSFSLFSNFHILVNTIGLPKIFYNISIIFGLASIFFLWNCIRAASSGFFMLETNPINLLRTNVIGSLDYYDLNQPKKEKIKHKDN